MPNRAKFTLADLRVRLCVRLAVAPPRILKALSHRNHERSKRDELRRQLIDFLTFGWDSLEMDITGPPIVPVRVPPATPLLDAPPYRVVDSAQVHPQPATMCNLYNLRQSRGEVIGLFRAADHWQADMAKDYVAPGLLGPVVIERDGKRISGLMEWGVPNANKLVTNVRNLESSFWRSLLDRPHHRCLVPVTEFQEWSAKPDPATGKKRPYWFAIPSRPVFAFAGIWRKVEGQPRYAFLTTEPNVLIGAVHPKAMPAILDDSDYDLWLSGDWAEARRLVTAYPSQLMSAT